MDFIYVRDSDSVVVNVSVEQVAPISGVTEYEYDWSLSGNPNWLKYKVTRNEDGSYTDTGVLQPQARIAQRLKWQDAGRKTLAIISDRNVQKGLSEAQILAQISTYQVILMTLLVGSIDIARNRVNAIVPDGVLITETDKTAILAVLDNFLNE
jgi:hypothetical protein